jgi:hypothetical protein
MPKNHIGNTQKCRYCGAIAETRLMPIWNTLENILTDPDTIYDKLKKYTGKNKKNDLLNKTVLIDKELMSLEKEQERTNRAFLDVCSINESEYQARILKIKKRKEELLTEKRKFNDYIISEEERNKRINIINHLYQTIKNKIRNSSYETKAEILHLFVNRINLNLATNTAQVEFNFSTEDLFLKDDCRDGCPAKNIEKEVTNGSVTPHENGNYGTTNEGEDTQNGHELSSFILPVKVPLISFEEIRKATNPTRSRYFRGQKDLPLKKLINKKAKCMDFIGYIQ